MDIRQLQYLIEIERQGSISRASQQLHLTQPTLSKMIKNLEEELGLVLFDRSTRKLIVTDAGRIVLAHAKMIMNALADLHAALDDLKQFRQGQFNLGLPPVIGSSFFPSIISRFQQQHPGIAIQIVEEGGKEIEHMITEGALDLGVVVMPVRNPAIDHIPLVSRKLNLVVYPGHPLAERNGIRLQELAGERLILFRRGFNLYDRVADACREAGFEPKVVHESSQWDMIGEMVAARLGIAFLPETICRKLDSRQIVVIERTEPVIHWDLALIWRKDAYLSHATKAWIDFVRREFAVAE